MEIYGVNLHIHSEYKEILTRKNSEFRYFSSSDGLSWNVFDKKGLHFLHINVNCILPQIEEIRFIAKNSKITVIGNSETKLDRAIFEEEIYTKCYSIVRCD